MLQCCNNQDENIYIYVHIYILYTCIYLFIYIYMHIYGSKANICAYMCI